MEKNLIEEKGKSLENQTRYPGPLLIFGIDSVLTLQSQEAK